MDLSLFTTKNLNEPEPWSNRRSVLLGLPLSFMLFSWICVAGRLYTRFRIIRSPGWDDLFVVLYALMTMAGTIAICKAVEYGLGQHFILLSLPRMKIYLQYFYVANAAYTSSTTFIKLALLFQYLRVFERGTTMHRIVVMVAIFTGLWGFAYSFLAWIPCFPVSAFWDISLDGRCYGYGSRVPAQLLATFESHTAINMALDLIVLIIPIPLFWREGTNFPQRMRLVGLLSMGILVIVFAAWRLVTIVEHQAATQPTLDPTWYGPISILLAVLEVDAAAVCASVPIFWPTLTQQWGKIFVTQEIKITRETRYIEEDDESELTGEHHSRAGSEAELKRTESNRRTEAHYQDSYILQQVDPLRSAKDSSRVEAAQQGNESNAKGNCKWTRL